MAENSDLIPGKGKKFSDSSKARGQALESTQLPKQTFPTLLGHVTLFNSANIHGTHRVCGSSFYRTKISAMKSVTKQFSCKAFPLFYVINVCGIKLYSHT
jgi:hypothetical protein